MRFALGYANATIRAIAEESGAESWAPTDGGGVILYDAAGTEIRRVSHEEIVAAHEEATEERN